MKPFRYLKIPIIQIHIQDIYQIDWKILTHIITLLRFDMMTTGIGLIVLLKEIKVEDPQQETKKKSLVIYILNL